MRLWRIKMGELGVSIDTSSSCYDTSKFDQYNDLVIAAEQIQSPDFQTGVDAINLNSKINATLVGWFKQNIELNSAIYARYALAVAKMKDDAVWLELPPTVTNEGQVSDFEEEIDFLSHSLSNSFGLQKHSSTLELAKQVADMPVEDDVDINSWAERLARDIALAKD